MLLVALETILTVTSVVKVSKFSKKVVLGQLCLKAAISSYCELMLRMSVKDSKCLH